MSNADDVVSTVLNPTEDYKTSVLSGLDPTTIMECAGRALSFWAYQTTQEMYTLLLYRESRLDVPANAGSVSCYQEYLSKGLTEKYGTLNTDMDKIIHSANAEITTLHNKLSGSSHLSMTAR
jgi:E3 ubiquitin-protein ligase CCNP1IP1